MKLNYWQNFYQQLPGRPTSSPSRNPITGIGQQIGEYMRRISDYFYWIVSGRPPITRKKSQSKLRAQKRRPTSRKYVIGAEPIRRRSKMQRRGPIRMVQRPARRRIGRVQVARGKRIIPLTQERWDDTIEWIQTLCVWRMWEDYRYY